LALFKIYKDAAEKRKPVPREIRDSLIKCLHYKYNMTQVELSLMLKISKRRINFILKELGQLANGSLEIQMQNH